MAGASACDTAAVPVIPGSSMSTGGGSGGSPSASTSSAASSSSGGVTPKSYWAKRFGNEHFQEGVSVAVSPAGNIAVLGQFTGTLDFGLGPLESENGIPDLFLVVLDPGGNPLWNRNILTKRFSGKSPGTLAFAGEDLIVAGTFSPQFPVDLGQGNLISAGLTDVFIARFDPHGEAIWSRSFGDYYKQSAFDVVTDAKGNAYLIGQFNGAIDFGTGPFNFGLEPQNAPWYSSVFLVKLDPAGNTLAATAFNGQHADAFAHLAVDAHGNVYMAGIISGKIDFGAGELTSEVGHTVIFAAAYDAELHPIYAKKLEAAPGAYSQYFLHLAAGATGNVVVSALVDGPVDFGSGAAYGEGEFGAVLLKLDSAGNRLWDRALGQQVTDGFIALGAGSDVLFASRAMGSVDLGLGLLTVPEESEALVMARFDASGNLVANRSMSGPAATVRVSRIAVTQAGDVALVGDVGGALDLGFGPLGATEGPDLLVAQLPAP